MSTFQLSADSTRCLWCSCKLMEERRRMNFKFGDKSYETVVCSAEHELSITRAVEYIHKFMPVYWIGLAITISLLLISNFVHTTTWFVLAAFFTLGLTMMLCPFATPQTVEIFGLKRSLLFVRISGMVFLAIVLGLSIALFLK